VKKYTFLLGSLVQMFRFVSQNSAQQREVWMNLTEKTVYLIKNVEFADMKPTNAFIAR
jgi:hypothetical protein